MSGEMAHYWRHPAIPRVDLLRARFVTHRYGRHAHPTYTIALIEAGVEEFDHAGASLRAGAGQLVIVNPEVIHTGYAGVPEGWRYRVLYPALDVVREMADELGHPRGTPYFPETVVNDPVSANLVRTAHRTAEDGDSLAASSAIRSALAGLLRRHASLQSDPAPRTPAPPVVRAVRDILHERLLDPPSLEELAALVEMGPFALLRVFRSATGLPPHAYLTHVRVRRARDLLDAGVMPAEVAARTGFADQAHLTRHFKRVVGVPPGAYQRGRVLTAPHDPAS